MKSGNMKLLWSQAFPFATTLLGFLKPEKEPKQETESHFSALLDGKVALPTNQVWAYRNQDWLNLEVTLANGDLMHLHLYRAFGEGYFELGDHLADNLHYARVERGGWLGQTYSTCSFYAGGYVQLDQLTPLSVKGRFAFNAVIDTSTYNQPASTISLTEGTFQAPILSVQ